MSDSNNSSTGLRILDNAIIVAVMTVLGYYALYCRITSYFDYFGIPRELIDVNSFDLLTMVDTVINVIFIFVIVSSITSFVRKIFKAKEHSGKWYLIWSFLFYISDIESVNLDNNKFLYGWIIVLVIFEIADLIWKDRVLNEKSESTNIIDILHKLKPSGQLTLLFVAVIIAIFAIYVLEPAEGKAVAKTKCIFTQIYSERESDSTNNRLVILAKRHEQFICSYIDQSNHLAGTFILISLDSIARNPDIRMKKINVGRIFVQK